MMILKAVWIITIVYKMKFTGSDISVGGLFGFVIVLTLIEMYISYVHDKKIYTKGTSVIIR